MAALIRLRVLLISAAALIGGCDRVPVERFPFLGPSEVGGAATSAGASNASLVEVEAPEVLTLEAAALWDGRPSLGGVWVAHPDVDDPERVRISRMPDGRFVDGALFRRERDLPGPPLQVSSDAAEALGLLAGQPTRLRVVALRPDETPSSAALVDGPRYAEPAPRPVEPLDRPFVQAATFVDAAAAERSADALRDAGLEVEVRRRGGEGRPTWRVLIGPAASEEAREAARDRVVTLGYSDAYYVAD